MTVDYTNQNEFQRIKSYLDEKSIEKSSRNDLTENWILDTIKHYSNNNISFEQEDFRPENQVSINASNNFRIGRCDKPNLFCSTPLVQLKNQDLISRFESAYSVISYKLKAQQSGYLDESEVSWHKTKDNENNKTKETQSLIEDSGVEEDDNFVLRLDNTTQLVSQSPCAVKKSEEPRDWLRDYLLQHAAESNEQKKINDNKIVIKVKPMPSSSICKRLNLQTILKKKCEKRREN